MTPPPTPPSEFEAENRRLREEHKTIWHRAKRMVQRQVLPRGLLPEKVFKEKIVRDREIAADEFDTRYLVGQLESAVKNIDDMNDQELSTLSEALRGEVPTDMADNTRVAIVAMRQRIDTQSTELVGILNQQAIDLRERAEESGNERLMGEAQQRAELMEIITGNVGVYLHRSFEVFDNPKYYKTIPSGVIDNARSYLTNRYLEEGMEPTEAAQRSEQMLEEITKNGTAYDGLVSFIKEARLGAKDLSVLKKRKEIAPEILALMGEYKDPRLVFAKTTTKMSRLIWNQRFLDKVLETGLDDFLFKGTNRPPEASIQIAAESSKVYAPLNGLWITPEMQQAFNDVFDTEVLGDIYGPIVRINGMIKLGKTVLSPATAVVNWVGSMFMTLSNGHFKIKSITKALSMTRAHLAEKGPPGKLAYIRRGIQLGVLHDTPLTGEMVDLLKDTQLEDAVLPTKGAKITKKMGHMAKSFYQYGDDFWKLVGFESEKSLLVKAGFSETEAETMAAEYVDNTYFTYSKVPKGIKSLRRIPTHGTFVSFPASLIRASYNQLSHIASYLQDPRTRGIGLRRLVSFSATSGALYALTAATKLANGLDDEDEEAVRVLSAPWDQNASLAFTGRDNNGNLTYINTSRHDPQAMFKKAITAMVRNQPWEDSFKQAADELLTPFFGVDMSAGIVFEILSNKKRMTGGRVYIDHDLTENQIADSVKHLKKLMPGFTVNAERTWDAIKGKVDPMGKKRIFVDEILAFGGVRDNTLDPKVSLYYRTFDFKGARKDAAIVMGRTANNLNEMSESEVLEAYEDALTIRGKAFNVMFRQVNAARQLGLDDRDIEEVLRFQSVSRNDVNDILDGVIPDWKPTNQSEARAIKRIDIFLPPEDREEKIDMIRERYDIVLKK